MRSRRRLTELRNDVAPGAEPLDGRHELQQDDLSDPVELVQTLERECQEVNHDGHFGIMAMHKPEPAPASVAEGEEEDPEAEAEERRRFMRARNYGFARVEILPGSVGYVKFDFFADTEDPGAGETAAAAMNFLANASAVIIDLREGSETFGEHFAAELDAESRTMLYVPKGFAHGFITLCDDTEAFYFVDEEAQRLWAEIGYDLQYDVRRDANLAAAEADGEELDKTELRHSGRGFIGYEEERKEAGGVCSMSEKETCRAPGKQGQAEPLRLYARRGKMRGVVVSERETLSQIIAGVPGRIRHGAAGLDLPRTCRDRGSSAQQSE